MLMHVLESKDPDFHLNILKCAIKDGSKTVARWLLKRCDELSMKIIVDADILLSAVDSNCIGLARMLLDQFEETIEAETLQDVFWGYPAYRLDSFETFLPDYSNYVSIVHCEASVTLVMIRCCDAVGACRAC